MGYRLQRHVIDEQQQKDVQEAARLFFRKKTGSLIAPIFSAQIFRAKNR
jgi:hypothetical protein